MKPVTPLCPAVSWLFPVLICLGSALSQDVDLYAWTVNVGDTSTAPMDLVTDPADNAVVTGYEFLPANHSPPNGQRLVVAKYRPDGSLLWRRSSSRSSVAMGSAVASDRLGNTYVAGQFADTMTLEGRQFIARSRSDAFLAKYDPEGGLVWSRVLHGQGSGITVYDIVVGGDNHPVLLGLAGDTAVIGSDTLRPPIPSRPMPFLTKLSPEGEFLWTLHSDSRAGYLSMRDLVAKVGDKIVLAGNVTGLRHFGGAPIGFTGEDSTDAMPFLMQVGASGQVEWVRHFPGIRECHVKGIDQDSAGNIFFSAIISRRDYIIGSDTLRSPTGSFLLIVKTDSSGRLRWHRNIVYGGNMFLDGLGTDSEGNVYLKAQFSTQSAPSAFHVYFLESPGKGSEVMAKFDSLGAFVWYTVIPSNWPSIFSTGYGGLSRDKTGNMYVLGRFFGSRILNSRTFDSQLTRTYLAKIGRDLQGGILERFSSSWKRVDSKVGEPLFTVEYLKDRFYAGGPGLILSSPDGTDWLRNENHSPCFVYSLAYDNKGTYIGGATNGILSTSYDGFSWQGGIGHTPVASIYDLQWVGDRFWGAGESGNIMHSLDGSDWKSANWQPGYAFHAMAFSDRVAVAVGTDGRIFTSENRITWAAQASGTTKNLYGVAWNGRNFVAVGEVVLTSPDGKTWTPRPEAIQSPMQDFLAVKSIGGHFLAVGYNGRISTSEWGYEWKDYYYPCDCALTDVAANDSMIVIAGEDGKLLVSPRKGIVPVAARRTIVPGSRFRILEAGSHGIGVRFDLETRSDIRLTVYDLSGRKIASYSEKQLEAGTHSRTFPLATANSGMYLVEFTSNGHRVVGKTHFLR